MTSKNDSSVEPYSLMTADVYDVMQPDKDYEAEVQILKGFIKRYQQSEGKKLLDVACGTGRHLIYLAEEFQVAGFDISEQQIQGAKQRLPAATIKQADMRNFNLEDSFDVVTCLFSSIGYIDNLKDFRASIDNMARHLKPGGIVLIEPWVKPKLFDPNLPPHVQIGELPEKDIKVTCTVSSAVQENTITLEMHHMIEGPYGIEEFTEKHRITEYASKDFEQAFSDARLVMHYDKQGLTGRGLYIGTK